MNNKGSIESAGLKGKHFRDNTLALSLELRDALSPSKRDSQNSHNLTLLQERTRNQTFKRKKNENQLLPNIASPGIQMREYKDKRPYLIIGGIVDDYLGEYMAGGVIVVFGKGFGEPRQ